MSKTKTTGLTFLKPAGANESTKTVSARVPTSVYNSFNNAVQVAQRAGMSLSITDVIQEAMKAAVKEVKQACGEQAFQQDLALADKPAEAKPATTPAAGITKPTTPPAAPSKVVEPLKK